MLPPELATLQCPDWKARTMPTVLNPYGDTKLGKPLRRRKRGFAEARYMCVPSFFCFSPSFKNDVECWRSWWARREFGFSRRYVTAGSPPVSPNFPVRALQTVQCKRRETCLPTKPPTVDLVQPCFRNWIVAPFWKIHIYGRVGDDSVITYNTQSVVWDIQQMNIRQY